jgi:hypothetical protein
LAKINIVQLFAQVGWVFGSHFEVRTVLGAASAASRCLHPKFRGHVKAQTDVLAFGAQAVMALRNTNQGQLGRKLQIFPAHSL